MPNVTAADAARLGMNKLAARRRAAALPYGYLTALVARRPELEPVCFAEHAQRGAYLRMVEAFGANSPEAVAAEAILRERVSARHAATAAN